MSSPAADARVLTAATQCKPGVTTQLSCRMHAGISATAAARPSQAAWAGVEVGLVAAVAAVVAALVMAGVVAVVALRLPHRALQVSMPLLSAKRTCHAAPELSCWHWRNLAVCSLCVAD